MNNCYNDIKRSPKKEIPLCTQQFYPLTNILVLNFQN